MERLRELEIIAANALLKAVSSRFASGTQDRFLKFLADQGGVSSVVQDYCKTGDLEQSVLSYWNAKLEPDSLRLEDLVSALLISFATSLAASLLIEGGKAAFPALYQRLSKRDDLDRILTGIAKLEDERREHVQSILALLNRKAAAAKASQAELQQDLNQVRNHLMNGGTFKDFLGAATQGNDLTLVESVLRGVMLTEEQRETEFDLKPVPAVSEIVLKGLPLTGYFGAGQIVQTQIDALGAEKAYESVYSDVENFRRDIHLPLRDAHKHTYLRGCLGRPPKKVVPVADHDLSQLLDHPQLFMECRPLIAGLVLRRGGMTCHTAVLSRGMGIPCIQLGQSEFLKLRERQFAAIQDGTAMLWQTPPTNFHQFF